MNVSLTPELESWVLERVSSGRYRSSSEVVREAIRVLQDREELKAVHLDRLRRAVQVGVEDVEAGRVVELDPGLRDSIKSRGRQRLGKAPPE